MKDISNVRSDRLIRRNWDLLYKWGRYGSGKGYEYNLLMITDRDGNGEGEWEIIINLIKGRER
jgi:hypothetical protein